MREGAYIGALVALLVYFMLPMYGEGGAPVSVIPTANVVSNTGSLNVHVSNLPFSMLIFFALEIIGISVGIIAQMIFRRINKTNQ